jgi:hypothetical protein
LYGPFGRLRFGINRSYNYYDDDIFNYDLYN